MRSAGLGGNHVGDAMAEGFDLDPLRFRGHAHLMHLGIRLLKNLVTGCLKGFLELFEITALRPVERDFVNNVHDPQLCPEFLGQLDRFLQSQLGNITAVHSPQNTFKQRASLSK